MCFYQKGEQQKKYRAMHFPNLALEKNQNYFITKKL